MDWIEELFGISPVHAVSETIHLTLEDAAIAVRSRRVSPAELTEACLARIEAVEPRLNAFVTVTADLARAQAREAGDEIAAGRYRGPLHGIPVAVKDLFATKGIRTTAGSRILAEWIPDDDATVVRRLREAGAVLLGKLGLHEFAYGVSSVNPHFGDVHNPWDTTKIPGGSSGGSAVAVVAGEAYATLGSDTGGSIRIPASLCGCVGLKPTFGRASLFGAVPLSGEQNGDEIRMKDGKPVFLSNNAGGILGGISTGQDIIARFAVKPTSSIPKPMRTIDSEGHEVEIETHGRHDPCVGIRAVPVGEAMMACVLADHLLRYRAIGGAV